MIPVRAICLHGLHLTDRRAGKTKQGVAWDTIPFDVVTSGQASSDTDAQRYGIVM